MRDLTLRDHFAASANVEEYRPLDSYKRNYGKSPTMDELAEYIAKIRYIEADAMLKEREFQ